MNQVIQMDRDAAADRLGRSPDVKGLAEHPARQVAQQIRDGKLDTHAWVQEFASFRLNVLRSLLPPEEGMVEATCKAICRSGKFETGQGTCAPICMEFLGDPRKSGCGRAAKVHSDFARQVLTAAIRHALGEGK